MRPGAGSRPPRGWFSASIFLSEFVLLEIRCFLLAFNVVDPNYGKSSKPMVRSDLTNG